MTNCLILRKIAIAAGSLIACAACNSTNDNGSNSSNSFAAPASNAGSGYVVGISATPDGVLVNPSGGTDAAVGTMTAGLWDDNANLDVFQAFITQQAQTYPSSLPAFDAAAMQTAHETSLQRTGSNAMDIALVLDTTGSMGDELSYLQTEFLGISSSVVRQFPQADVRWSLVVYRDIGDEYVTRAFDFTSAVDAFQSNLAMQRSAGGGDEPEAVPTAFNVSLGGSWRGTQVAQMLIWVADAPHHDSDTGAMRDVLANCRDRGIHIYPVAASSANPLAEATMRIAAQITGGRYLFLTDDSGIGNSHSEPKVPCYYVTTLADAISRSVAMELSGAYVAPTPTGIVRIVGKPNEATCDP